MGTSLHQSRESGKDTNYNQAAFMDGTLTAVKPHAKNKTIIRIIPQTDQAGNPVPMVVGQDEHGYLFSNLHVEPMVFGAGMQNKYTGSVIPSDIPGMPELDRPFQGLFVTVKGRVNKQNLAPHEIGPVMQLLQKGQNSPAALASVGNSLIVQCAVLQLDDKPCSPPTEKVGMILSSSALKSLNQVLSQAAKMNLDLFHPTTGYTIEISGIPGENGGPYNFVCGLGQPMPVPEAVWKNKFIPWNQIIKRHSYDDLVRKMESCYGAAVVAMRGSFKEALTRLGFSIPALGFNPQQAPAGLPAAPAGYPAQPPVGQPVGQPPVGWGTPIATAQPTPVVQPVQQSSAPAVSWGVPAAPVAPTAPLGWGAPAATTAPVQTTAPVVSGAPTLTSGADLQKMFNEAAAKAAADAVPKTA